MSRFVFTNKTDKESSKIVHSLLVAKDFALNQPSALGLGYIGSILGFDGPVVWALTFLK